MMGKAFYFPILKFYDFMEIRNMDIRIETKEYEVKRTRFTSNSSKIVMGKAMEGVTYNVIPIPYDVELDDSEDNVIRLESNVIFRKVVGKSGQMFIPKEYEMADVLIYPFKGSMTYISSDFKNYFIKRPFPAGTVSRVDLPKDFGENVYSVFYNPFFNRESENLVEEVFLRSTVDLKRQCSINLPKECAGHAMVFFEDDYFEF